MLNQKKSIFIGLQIREIINDLFEHLLMRTEISACLTFKTVVEISLET